MAEKLSDKLQPASFRGVPFHVLGARVSAGRRVEVHEYPRRDKPFVEDLGRATREFTVRGFLIGLDYVEQVEKLLDALEEEGPGTLIHPWHGSLTVSLKGNGDVDYSEKLGMATVDMLFVESGDLEYPSATAATGMQSRLAADNLGDAITTDFAEKFGTDGFPDFVTDAAIGDLSSIINLAGSGTIPGLSQLGYVGTAQTALSSALSLINNPTSLGSSLLGFFGLAGRALGALNIASAIQSLLRMASHDSLQPPAAPVVSTPSRLQQVQNTAALNALTRQSVLTQAVGLSSLMPVTVYDDAVAIRDQLTKALDAESQTASDPVYHALQGARVAVWQDLTERARDGARLDVLQPPTTLPSLVLAYDLYERADRDGELVARNGVRHPGFVPPKTLKVLAR